MYRYELFMTGPDVDIAALEGELERVQGKLAEQAAVIQCLDKDLETVGAYHLLTIVHVFKPHLSCLAVIKPLYYH
jgi:hypothetical protein